MINHSAAFRGPGRENRDLGCPPLPGLPAARLEPRRARRRWPGMAAKRDDDLKDSFYLYIMRSSIGAGLKSQYAPNGHMPDRLAELLKELESAEDKSAEDNGAAKQTGREQDPPREQARKT
jgi:hypothetical protein